ncbi:MULTISPECIES: type IV pilin-like G/H family protein [unclassified Microcoleus]|uniref:type IV pilin-like G/H family protein n=1 Tax=unclassified Microcoleus TaxID=2642155 RepID=UPI002FD1CE82
MTNNQESIVRNAACRGCGCLLLIAGIGVLNGIALPFYLNNTNRSKQSEAKQYVSSMNKAQQAYFAEKSVFSTSVNALELGIKTETTNYKYSLRATKQTAFNYGVSKQLQLKSYVGGVFRVPVKKVEPNAAKDGITTISIFCQADSPGTIKPAEPTYEKGKIDCGQGTRQVTK